MPLPIIADVFRMTLLWAVDSGVTPRNVLHWRDSSSGHSEVDLGLAFDAHISNDLWLPVHSGHELPAISIIKLDGTSPEVPYTLSPGAAGGASGDCMPGVAQLLSIRTGTRGPSGRGRCYFGPIGEAWNLNGLAASGTDRTTFFTTWETFLNDMAADDWVLCVASYAHDVSHDCTGLVAPEVLGTQRRRQDQLR